MGCKRGGATLLCAGVLFLMACGSSLPTQPVPDSKAITVLVENNSCEAGRCMTLELRVFVWSFKIPQNPLGYRALAEVPPGTHCVTLPDTMFVRLIGPGTGGGADTTVLVWHANDPAGIHLVGVDSAAYHGGPASPAQTDSLNRGIYPYDGSGPSIGESRIFVPTESEGWRTAFPASPPHAGEVLAIASCAG